ncbi:tetratricopeptide repeat protein [Planctomycetota bacterium]
MSSWVIRRQLVWIEEGRHYALTLPPCRVDMALDDFWSNKRTFIKVPHMFYEGMELGPYDNAERNAHKAFELYEDGDMSHALDELNQALEINPANSSWHFDKGLALDAIHRFEEAIEEYETALELNPGDLEILNSLAVDYTRTGQYDRAIETFEYIQQLEPEFEPSFCNRIIAYTEMGLHEQAEEMFYMAQQIEPGCALCYYNIGNSLFVRGQYQKAIGCWRKTAELEPTHPQIHYRIAQAYWSEGCPDEAREYFLTELRNNPGDVDVILDYGIFLLGAGAADAAKEKFNRVLEFNPNHPIALFYLGEMAYNDGAIEQALDCYNQALRFDDMISGPYYRLAEIALLEGKKQKARAYLISELRNTGDHAKVLASLGSMFLAVAEVEPTSDRCEPASTDLSYPYRHAGVSNSDLDRAAHCLLRALELDDTDADTYHLLGLVSAMKGLARDAVEFFTHALDIQSDHGPALRDAALAYFQLEQWHEARDYLKKANAVLSDDGQLKSLRGQLSLQRSQHWLTGITQRVGRWFKPDKQNTKPIRHKSHRNES